MHTLYFLYFTKSMGMMQLPRRMNNWIHRWNRIFTQYTDDLLGLTCELAPANVADTKNTRTVMKADADEIFEDRMKHSVLFYRYVFDDTPLLPKAGDCTFMSLCQSLTPRNTFVMLAQEKWHIIAFLHGFIPLGWIILHFRRGCFQWHQMCRANSKQSGLWPLGNANITFTR